MTEEENKQKRAVPAAEPLVEVATDEDTVANAEREPTPEDVIREIERERAAEARRRMFSRSLADVRRLVPEEDDPTVLFRHNWLARGQVAQLTASSGVGKSSMSMQTAFNWAAGLPFLAEPMHPLRCAVIQAEDSERDVAEQIEGMHKGLVGLRGWSEELFESARRSILCPTCFIGKQGEEFIRMLAEFQGDMRCDMLFINPVQAFFGGNISDQEDVSRWTRGGIDPIIKDTEHNGERACGAFLVMHTTKFTSGNKDGRANVDDYGEYIGAGSHEWLDWTRAKFVFLKHGKSEDYFDLKAAKRGKRLGWEDDDGEKTTNKIFKHSKDFIFWQEVTDPQEIAGIDAPAAAKTLSDEETAVIAERMIEWIRKNRAVTGTELSEKSDAFRSLSLSRKELRAGGAYIRAHWQDYHMTKNQDGYGFAEGHRKLAVRREQQRRIDETKLPSEPSPSSVRADDAPTKDVTAGNKTVQTKGDADDCEDFQW